MLLVFYMKFYQFICHLVFTLHYSPVKSPVIRESENKWWRNHRSMTWQSGCNNGPAIYRYDSVFALRLLTTCRLPIISLILCSVEDNNVFCWPKWISFETVRIQFDGDWTDLLDLSDQFLWLAFCKQIAAQTHSPSIARDDYRVWCSVVYVV